MSDNANNVVTDNDGIIDAAMPDVPPDTPTKTPNKIYLKDYRPPNFAVKTVDLDIRVFDDYAVVDSCLHLLRQQEGALHLLGNGLELQSISLNGKVLQAEDYQLDTEGLTIANVPDEAVIKTQVKISPQTNTTLEGLYRAGEGEEMMYVTQCEPEGFRKITFYPDRPDVLAEFTTRLEADKCFPTLLANGNLVEQGDVADNSNRHYAIWHDPTKKPSYLFACVVADLDVLTDRYTTSEGREVLLELYAKSSDIDKCHVGMQALKDAMKWDEDNYGRAYDLDRYMIVAVSQFNMGAMENKGLNIFNTACVLSSPETTTDARSFNVKAVIAHEYFHNWTGNRITCRDWFQLCLKEGFTVYRDQSFSADQQSPAVQRIDDVAILRAHQFAEDASPLAHAVRPESFVEINNFYTTTVYEKGAEIVRMMANIMGKEKFRQGTDEYFRRYDGQAVTVEDFLSALSVGQDVEHFLQWYRQPATPTVSGYHLYDPEQQTVTITLSQYSRHVEGYEPPKPLPIPIATAIFAKETGDLVAEKILMLDNHSKTFVFENIQSEPVVSLLRNFSAPVLLDYDHSESDLDFLVAYETNGFNRWQATQSLTNGILLRDKPTDTYLQAMIKAIPDVAKTDPMLASRLLDLPSEREIATAIERNLDPIQVKQKRDALKQQLANALKNQWTTLYQQLPIENYQDSPQAMGQRALRNVVLDMALTTGIQEAHDWASHQYNHAQCMTERLGALQAMVNHQHQDAQKYLDDFYQRFNREALVIDLWFSLQSANEHAEVKDIQALLHHSDFDWGTPNRIRAVVSSFASQPVLLWTQAGLALYTEVIARLDKENPVLASRLLQALARWYTLIDERQKIAKNALTQLRTQVTSKNVLESLESVLSVDSKK